MEATSDNLDRSSASQQESLKVSPSQCRKSVHQSLGGGAVADLLLWKKRNASAFLLVSASILWFLFERAGYSFVLLVTNTLLLQVVILFLWAKSAYLLNRPLPPLPNMEISDECVGKIAEEARILINHLLAVARKIALEGNVKLFLQVAVGLWLVSCIGNLFNFLTLVYTGVILSLTVPPFYDQYQDQVDEKLCVAHKVLLTQYKKVEEIVLSKIRKPTKKEKKIQ